MSQDLSLSNWRKKEKNALDLLTILGDLRFDKNVELMYFHHDLYDSRPSEIINTLSFSTKYTSTPIEIDTALAITRAISNVENLAPSKIDLGKLCMEWLEGDKDKFESVEAFANSKLSEYIGWGKKDLKAKDVVLYGFGRIGRLVARRIVQTTGKGEQLVLRAIVLRMKMKTVGEELEKRAALLRQDSVHGAFNGVVNIDAENEEMIINGNRVKIIFAGKPADIDYTEYGIQNGIVIDNTGVWRNKEQLSGHLRPGIVQVMLTAPGDGVPNIVHGINQKELDFEKDNVFSAASCTTNAIAPVLKVIHDKFGIDKGHIETIHAYTNDQNLIDNFHKKPRRGRGAPLNMVLTSTGAAKAVGKVIPDMVGILTGNAVRVPTPNVSLAIMSLTLKEAVDLDLINNTLRHAALHGKLVEQIHYSNDTEFVSHDALGLTSTSILDAPSSIVSKDGLTVTLYVWYDNEYGYSCQVVRLAKYVSQVRRLRYY
ncbi:MAG: glyceraldehyde-3-phosphate dehydrogenase [Saprospiraceae bacterium]